MKKYKEIGVVKREFPEMVIEMFFKLSSNYSNNFVYISEDLDDKFLIK